MPPNLRGAGARRRRQKRRRRRERTQKEIARVRSRGFFVTREVLLDRFLKREDAAGARSRCFSIDFCFLFLFATVRSVDQKSPEGQKKGEKRNFYLTFVLLSLSFELYLTTTTTTTTVQLRRANAPRPGMGERFLLQERRG
jgi:hypothetical protein